MIDVDIDCCACAEYKDDSSLIPRGTSLIVKRMPAVRPGKGKAAMYIAGVGNSAPTSEPVQRPGSHSAGGGPTWHKGAMSKRFDGKEESPLNKPPAVRACSTVNRFGQLNPAVLDIRCRLSGHTG